MNPVFSSQKHDVAELVVVMHPVVSALNHLSTDGEIQVAIQGLFFEEVQGGPGTPGGDVIAREDRVRVEMIASKCWEQVEEIDRSPSLVLSKGEEECSDFRLAPTAAPLLRERGDVCPWRNDELGKQSALSRQLTKDRDGLCCDLAPRWVHANGWIG